MVEENNWFWVSANEEENSGTKSGNTRFSSIMKQQFKKNAHLVWHQDRRILYLLVLEGSTK